MLKNNVSEMTNVLTKFVVFSSILKRRPSMSLKE